MGGWGQRFRAAIEIAKRFLEFLGLRSDRPTRSIEVRGSGNVTVVNEGNGDVVVSPSIMTIERELAERARRRAIGSNY